MWRKSSADAVLRFQTSRILLKPKPKWQRGKVAESKIVVARNIKHWLSLCASMLTIHPSGSIEHRSFCRLWLLHTSFYIDL